MGRGDAGDHPERVFVRQRRRRGAALFSVQAGPNVLDAGSYRVVVFDIGGRRYEPKTVEAGGLGNGSTKLNSVVYSLDPKALAPDKVAYLGVERVNPVRNP